jgi:CRP/FNR family transcriptional regulator
VLKVARRSSGGEQRILAILGAGAIVGELAMIDGLPRSATVIALRLSRLSFVTRSAFLETLREMPHLNEYLVGTLAARLRNTDEDAAATTFLNVSARVARALLHIAQHLGEPAREDDRVVLRHNLRQSDIAALAGVARESVSRTISEWRRRGIIENVERHACVIVRPMLEAEARQE